MSKDSVKEWRYVVSVPEKCTVKDIERTLEEVMQEPGAFTNLDEKFFADAEAVTVVPIEIALTVEMRSEVLNCMPQCKYIVTKVEPSRINNLINNYGYKLVIAKHVEEEKNGIAKTDDSVQYIVNGKKVTAEEYAKAAKPIIDEMAKMEKEMFKRFATLDPGLF